MAAERDVSAAVGTKVFYRPRGKRGKVEARILRVEPDHIDVVGRAGFASIRYEQVLERRR